MKDDCESESSPAKKIKLETNEIDKKSILEYIEKEYQRRREMYVDHVLELFFLEQQGNLMDYYNWRKKPPTVGLLQYLRTFAADNDEDFEQLQNVKSSLDSTLITPIKLSSIVTASELNSVSQQPLPYSSNSSNIPITGRSSSLTSSSHAGLKASPLISSSFQSYDFTSPSITSTGITTARGANAIPTSLTLSPLSTSNLSNNTRKSHKQHSISAVYESSIGSQEQIVERAKQEAYVMQRIAELRKEGLWSAKRLPKVQEPPRAKAQWDYLLEEMAWLATDFAQERKWKKTAAKKCARMVMKYHQDKELQAEKAEKEEIMRLKRTAATISREIRNFWTNIEKIVEFRQQTRLEEKRKKALNLHLNYIVNQTEKYSSWLAEGMTKGSNQKNLVSSVSCDKVLTDMLIENKANLDGDDCDFEPEIGESDDEETIAKEEEEFGIEGDTNELDLLQKESEIPLEELISSLPKEIFDKTASVLTDNEDDDPDDSDIIEHDKIKEEGKDKSLRLKEKDKIEDCEMKSDDERTELNHDDDEFEEESEEEDDEQTIQEQEEQEKGVDYKSELKDLEDEANLSYEELINKYKGSSEGNDYEMGSENDTKEDADTEGSETEMSKKDIETEEDESDNEEESFSENESENEEIGMEFLINPNSTKDKPLMEVSA